MLHNRKKDFIVTTNVQNSYFSKFKKVKIINDCTYLTSSLLELEDPDHALSSYVAVMKFINKAVYFTQLTQYDCAPVETYVYDCFKLNKYFVQPGVPIPLDEGDIIKIGGNLNQFRFGWSADNIPFYDFVNEMDAH